jgi:hypothetical protein
VAKTSAMPTHKHLGSNPKIELVERLPFAGPEALHHLPLQGVWYNDSHFFAFTLSHPISPRSGGTTMIVSSQFFVNILAQSKIK